MIVGANTAKQGWIHHVDLVVVGASAGALEALSQLLSPLPADFPLPIVAVIHIRSDRKNALSDCLRVKCQMNVYEAEDKEPIIPGTIYIAPPDYHLLVEANHRLSLSSERPVGFSRPSIDVLFESAAEAFHSSVVGIILTGANQDGARGLKAIQQAGGISIVQRPDTAFAREMPRAALVSCPDALVMTVEEIAAYLRDGGPSG